MEAGPIEDVVRRAPESTAAAARLVERRTFGSANQSRSDSFATAIADAVDDVRRCVADLELMVIAICTLEAVAELGAGATPTAVVEAVRHCAGIDVDQAMHDWRDEQPPPPPAVRELTSIASEKLDTLVPYIRMRIETCPIDAIVQMGSTVHRADLAHRARRACDGVRSFLLRRDPSTDAKVRLVGRLYASGELEMHEAASLLDRTVPDVIALLEERGFARTIAAIRLSPGDRQAILARVRMDRERRGGRPAPSDERINRNVIASERIEGIDARAWLADG